VYIFVPYGLPALLSPLALHPKVVQELAEAEKRAAKNLVGAII